MDTRMISIGSTEQLVDIEIRLLVVVNMSIFLEGKYNRTRKANFRVRLLSLDFGD